jgi:arylsulfatase A-like enzyme
VASVVIFLGVNVSSARIDQPNVILIVCDDLNRLGSGVSGEKYISAVKTPHLDAFAETATVFTRAYANVSLCSPSRASLFTGVAPQHSQFYSNTVWWRNAQLAEAGTLMDAFRAAGYRVFGTGKIMHHFRKREWDAFGFQVDYGPMVWDGTNRVALGSIPEPFRSEGPIGGSFGPLKKSATNSEALLETQWVCRSAGINRPYRYENESDRDRTPDEKSAIWAKNKIDQLATDGTDSPFFFAIGFVRPHTPLHVPARWFDLYSPDSFSLPVQRKHDRDDTYLEQQFTTLHKGFYRYQQLISSYQTEEEGLRAWIQAYLASVSAVDACIGVVVDALKSQDLWQNTILIITSDHGYQLGQKEFLFKGALWEESMRIPLLVRVPGMPVEKNHIDTPVSLIDIYPTLVELCGLTVSSSNQVKRVGVSIEPLLNPGSQEKEERMALGVMQSDVVEPLDERWMDEPFLNQHWTLRTDRWRYIRYQDGSEELYDHQTDPHEWYNLAGDLAYMEQQKELAQQLRKVLSK